MGIFALWPKGEMAKRFQGQRKNINYAINLFKISQSKHQKNGKNKKAENHKKFYKLPRGIIT